MNHLQIIKILNTFVTEYLKSQDSHGNLFTYRHYHCSCHMDYTKRRNSRTPADCTDPIKLSAKNVSSYLSMKNTDATNLPGCNTNA